MVDPKNKPVCKSLSLVEVIWKIITGASIIYGIYVHA